MPDVTPYDNQQQPYGGMDNSQMQQSIMDNPYTNPLSPFGSSIVLMTNPQNILYDLELTLRSLKEKEDGKLEQIDKPMLNNYGVTRVLGYLKSIVNQITIVGNIEKHNFQTLGDNFADVLAKDLMLNKKVYEIRDDSVRTCVYFICLNFVVVGMKRGFNEGERRFWKNSIQQLYTQAEGEPQRKGILDRIMNIGKK